MRTEKEEGSTEKMLNIPHITYNSAPDDRKNDYSMEAYENTGDKKISIANQFFSLLVSCILQK